jgi:hypothetical protein
MIATRTVTEFPLNDQEILLRHLHKVVADKVTAYRAEEPRDAAAPQHIS